MKLYDFVRAWVNDADYDIEGPVIVLTKDELQTLWKLAMQHGVRPYDTVSFEDYLQAEGIIKL